MQSEWDIVAKLRESLNLYLEGINKANDGVEKLTTEIETTVSTQSKSLSDMHEALNKQMPESLGQLEKTLTGLTQQFGDDYKSFLDKVSQLTKAV